VQQWHYWPCFVLGGITPLGRLPAACIRWLGQLRAETKVRHPHHRQQHAGDGQRQDEELHVVSPVSAVRLQPLLPSFLIGSLLQRVSWRPIRAAHWAGRGRLAVVEGPVRVKALFMVPHVAVAAVEVPLDQLAVVVAYDADVVGTRGSNSELDDVMQSVFGARRRGGFYVDSGLSFIVVVVVVEWRW